MHILESSTFTWDVFFSFVLIVGHLLSPTHPPGDVLLRLLACLFAQML